MIDGDFFAEIVQVGKGFLSLIYEVDEVDAWFLCRFFTSTQTDDIKSTTLGFRWTMGKRNESGRERTSSEKRMEEYFFELAPGTFLEKQPYKLL